MGGRHGRIVPFDAALHDLGAAHAWQDPANFDGTGMQRRSLAVMRERM